ncbi:TetR/AcrR family transcriptional regulator [Cryptosporangium arvum]|jgi:AcrR family transcriptional regulator|uniref:Transcriptional regulator n=1 Tax=Cryptosporangium arvum DSM 44712 TaxID=927661 RepID=A0A010Z5N7_9ACTN|nr:TetR family transcriptional regulator [Cryptosporangium arvum]EXG82658.1 transcriptional regulator [Cryptosporangium arvum DSM 44712]
MAPATRRQDSAAYTRTVILEAALDLFCAHGYASTTVNDVAARAGVAVATVYTSVGNKTTLLRTLVQRSANATEIDESVATAAAAADPRGIIGLVAAATGDGHEKYARVIRLMFETATTVPEIADETERVVSGYRANLRISATRLQELGALRAGTTVESAVDVLWFYFGLYSFPTLVRDNGWSYDRAKEWLADRAAEVLLDRG